MFLLLTGGAAGTRAARQGDLDPTRGGPAEADYPHREATRLLRLHNSGMTPFGGIKQSEDQSRPRSNVANGICVRVCNAILLCSCANVICV